VSDNSAIEWTHATWNPTTGCDQVSPGCDNCYALTLAKRLKAMGNPKYQHDGNPRTSGPGFGLTAHPDTLRLPLTRRKPRRIFVNSMSDLFHNEVPDEFIARVFAVMLASERHTFQVLTKRHARMRSLLRRDAFREQVEREAVDRYGIHVDVCAADTWPVPNVWLGVSVEDQRWADIRIPALLDTLAAVRWISVEPLLGPVDLTRLTVLKPDPPYGPGAWLDSLTGHLIGPDDMLPTRLDWVVAGGESGAGARPMDPDWSRGLRDQCQAAGVPFLFKQWGGRTPKAGGRTLDGRTWDEYPAQRAEVPA